MYKTKLIAKNYEHREERAPKDRLEQRGQMLFESDSEDSSGELQELDFNCFCSSEEENYSIQNFIENLRAEKSACFQQEEQEDSYPHSASSSLERINAQYLQMMARSPSPARPNCHIKFQSAVRVKFFNDQLPVVDLCASQQYTFSNDQYQQTTSDEERHCS